jgi:hypothetical protein
MKGTVPITQMIQLVLNSYTMLAINNHLKVAFVLCHSKSVPLLDALKIKILKNTVSTIMIQPSVRPLEISAMQTVL